MLKKVLSILLSVMIVCSMASVSVFAENASILEGLEADSLLYAPLIEDTNGTWLVDSIKLPWEYNGAKITWSSSNGNVISTRGSVARPASADATVTLTATATKGELTETKDFTFKVPALTTQVGTIPALSGTLINDDFADYKVSPYSVYNSSNYETDGHLLLCNKNNATFYPYLDKGATDFEGDFYTEFVITKGATHTGWIGFYGSNGETIFATDYKNKNDKMQLLSYKGVTGTDENGNTTYGWVYPETENEADFETAKIAFYFNSADQTVSVWINNKEFAMNQPTRWTADGKTDPITALDKIIIRSGSDINNIQLKDFKFYVVGENPLLDSEKVAADSESLTIDSLYFGNFVTGNVIQSNIRLPIAGENGSEITWSSSNTAVCDDSGKITRPAGSISTPVTLTATVKSGSESVTKTFDFSVAGVDLDYEAMPTLLNGDASNYKTNLTFDSATANVNDTKNLQTTLTFDGALKFTGAPNYNNNTHMGVRITADDKKEFLGVAVYEATISRSAKNTVDIRIELSSGNIGFRTEWRSDGKFYSYYRSDDGTAVKEEASSIAVASGAAKLVIFVDTTTERVAVWINGQKIVNGKTFSAIGTKKLRNLYVVCSNENTTVTIDDVKTYFATPATEHRYETDVAHLDEWTLPSAIENDLGATAQYGSYVNWTSDDESIINSKGVVTRPDDDLPHTVNLTANIMGVNAGETTQKSFTATVAGKDYNAFPTLYGNDALNMKADYNFDDGVLPAAISDTKSVTTTLTCANGVLSFKGAQNYNGSTPMGIRARAADNKEFRGVAAFEADITRSNTGKVILQLEGTDGTNLYGIEWPSSGIIQSRHADSADATSGWKSTNVTKATKFNIKIFVDPRTDRLTVWFDGEKAIDAYLNTDMSTVATRNFRDILIGCESTSTTIKVDNIKMYYALPATEHRLECDMVDFANYALPESVTEDIELPSKLPYGSYLTWTSDNDAITADGKVTRGEEDVVVNLTATPSAAGVTGEAKTFAVTVKAPQAPAYTVSSVDGSFKAQYFAVKDASGYPAEKCFLVLYDGKKLVTFKTAPIADAANDGTTPAAELEFTADEIAASGAVSPKAKAFIWKAGSIVPVSSSIDVGAAN